MTEREAVEKLKAYSKCQLLQVKGIYEDCNNERCDSCDLCYMQGTTGEHCESIDIAIQALEKQIEEQPTVYDVDKVVTELYDKSFERYGNSGMGGELVISLDDVVEIVKRGGVDER